jgi:curli biogenesis system outer membrane secretion channel CsgG
MRRNFPVAAIFAAVAVLIATVAAGPAVAQQDQKGKVSVGIDKIEVTEAVRNAVAEQGQDKLNSMNRVVQSMESQLIDRLHNTRKFKIIARGDLEKVLKEQDLNNALASGSGDAKVAKTFGIAGAKHVVITTVDDFQDLEKKLRGDGGQVIASKRIVRLSAVAKIYKTAGENAATLMESANFQLSNQKGKDRELDIQADGQESDKLLTAMARTMAQKVANRVTNVIFPAKIIAKTNKVVTINRGDGTNIAKGQEWQVFALGEKLVDPATGEVLGREEVPVGRVKVIDVTPKFSRAHVVKDYGVSEGQILRPVEEDSGKQAEK